MTNHRLRIAVIQFTPEFGKKEENLSRLDSLLAEPRADIIVLPELCTTGYLLLNREEVARAAETKDGRTVAFFREAARRLSAVVVAGFAERDGLKLYNACLVAVPEDDRLYIYRKTHLFYKEQHGFDPGDTGFFVIHDDFRDIKIGPMICYDWRFPESARTLALLGADLIVCPANLVTTSWRRVIPARAIENKVYLALANRAGVEARAGDRLKFKGRSAIYDYHGTVLTKAGLGEDEIVLADIFPLKTRDKSFNPINDILQDRRPELYGPLVEIR